MTRPDFIRSNLSEAEIDSLRDQLKAEIERREKAEAALQPFAAIQLSTFYPADGSENEGYAVFLCQKGDKPDFTRADLARARTARSAPAQQKDGE